MHNSVSIQKPLHTAPFNELITIHVNCISKAVRHAPLANTQTYCLKTLPKMFRHALAHTHTHKPDTNTRRKIIERTRSTQIAVNLLLQNW